MNSVSFDTLIHYFCREENLGSIILRVQVTLKKQCEFFNPSYIMHSIFEPVTTFQLLSPRYRRNLSIFRRH